MSKKNYKRIVAAALAATMVFGSALTVYADPESQQDEGTPGVSTGTGSYEGGELKYPTLSVTLPTIPEGTYDYIADPNGLIGLTDNAKYEDAEFTGDTGIYFETSDNTYSEKSAAQEVENQNAQDIDVTVKVEVTTPGDSSIQYASSATFADEDTTNGFYLAITDDAEESPKVAALSTSGVATLTTTVEGNPDNYQAGYSSDDGYGYTLKTAEDDSPLTWNKCSFILTGALNLNATWGDDIEFPEITITWSYKEHADASVTETAVSGSSNVVHYTVPEGVTVSKVEIVKTAGVTTLSSGSHYTVNAAAGTINITASVLTNNKGNTLKVTFSNEATVELPIN